MWNLVARVIMKVEDLFPIPAPGVPLNRVAFLVSHATRVSAVNRAHPDIEHIVLVWRQPTQLGTIGRDFWIRALWIAKKDFAGNERRQLRINGESIDCYGCHEEIFHHVSGFLLEF